MHKIGIISDTHGLLRQEVLKELQGCEIIFHAGDIGKGEILDKLKGIAPVYAVRGNIDREDTELPESVCVKLWGLGFFMVHDRKRIPKQTDAWDIILYGHSHKYEEKRINHQLLLNPGGCGPKRFLLPVTMAVLEVGEDSSYLVKRIDLSDLMASSKNEGSLADNTLPLNIQEIIEAVMRDTERGKSIAEIARKNRISEDLAEKICRLYVTHPGVDADGIMRKMGL